jgi:uncharacterized protein (UPF0332 family)
MVKTLKLSYDECIKQGLLRKIPVSQQKAAESIITAEKWLDEAQKNLSTKSLRSCLLSAYLAMFHAARSILWSDGFREKSHACIGRYLESVYVNQKLLDKKWVDLFDYYRNIRHDDSYSTSFNATEEECVNVLKSSREFIYCMKTLLDKKCHSEK